MKKMLTIIVLLAFCWHNDIGLPSIKNFIMAPIKMAEGVATGAEIHNLQKILANYKALNGQYPDIDGLERAIADNYDLGTGRGDPRTDAWGNYYHYERRGRGYIIVSDGPDGAFNTGDDLVFEVEE